MKKKVVYAIQVASLSYSGLKILDVKIGKTKNIGSTISQYKRSHRQTKILDLWEPNQELSLSNCERGAHSIAEKYAYERKSEKFIFLQDSYNEFSKTLSSLLNPISKTEIKEEKGNNVNKDINKSRESYIGKKPRKVRFREKNFEVQTWRNVLEVVSKEIYKEVEDFSKATEIKGTKRIYFSKNKDDLIRPKRISDTPYYFEGNISAKRTMIIVDRLLEKFDYDKETEFDLKIRKAL